MVIFRPSIGECSQNARYYNIVFDLFEKWGSRVHNKYFNFNFKNDEKINYVTGRYLKRLFQKSSSDVI